MRNNFIIKQLPARIKPKLFIQLFLSLLLAAFSKTLSAQDNTNPSFKRFGFQAGVNAAAMNFNLGNPAPAQKEKLSWKAGISFGFLLGVPLAKNLFLQTEYNFIQRNGEDKSLAKTYSLNYFSLPALLFYKLSPVVAVMAGPQAEILINARSTSSGENSNITHDTEERSIGVAAGLEATVINNIFLSARYFRGLNHIGIGQRSDIKEFKYEAITLTAGIRF
jgi:hypothetical protein